VTFAKQLHRRRSFGTHFPLPRQFLQDWTIGAELPQARAGLWRLDAAAAGSGVTGDLLAHCIDTALWLNGTIGSVSAMTETFIKQRAHTGTGAVQEVKIDDACCITWPGSSNGSLATFESTRYARGLTKRCYALQINGENAPTRVGSPCYSAPVAGTSITCARAVCADGVRST